MAADSTDHVPPTSVREYLLMKGWKRNNFYEVRACRECNSMLGASPPYTPRERRKRIKELLLVKYEKYILMPSLSPQELEALGPVLRSEMLRSLAVRDLIFTRVAWKAEENESVPT